MQTSDAELLERWRTGDLVAGAALVERYYKLIERFFVNKVAEREVRDLVQETFEGCVKGRDRVKEPSKFRSYLVSIAHNVLKSYIHTKAKAGESVNLEEISMADLSPGPRSVIVDHSEQRLLLEGLRRIPADYQIILELHYWEEMTLTEIAKTLGTKRSVANGRLQRARQRLELTLRRITKSQEILDSTLDDLDGWARRWRRKMGREPSTDE